MCGVCGVYVLDKHNLPDIARALEVFEIDGKRLIQNGSVAAGIDYFLLRQLNNRGHDSSGIVAFDGTRLHIHKGMGFAQNVFGQESLEKLVGDIAIGHDRYATRGLPKPENVQPFYLNLMALAHNGNIVNEEELRRMVIEEETRLWGQSQITSTTDSELKLHKLALEFHKDKKAPIEKLVARAFSSLRGAYSVTMIIGDSLVGVRDPYGIWPLYIARLGGIILFASERISIQKFVDAAGYKLHHSDFIRSVGGGEVEVITRQASTTHFGVLPLKDERQCSFDYSYVRSHEDQKVRGFREKCGMILGDIFPANADYVVPIPNSGIYYAKGFSEALDVPYGELIGVSRKYKSKEYRTFQESTQEDRLKAAKEKYIFMESYDGLRLILTDDTIVRNTTMRFVITELRKRRAAEIHVRIGTPSVVTPCYLGIHTPTKQELIASTLSEEHVERYFESIFYGANYEKDELVALIRGGMSVEQIVSKSVQDEKNFLNDAKLREVVPSRFSLKYMPMSGYKKAFDNVGLDSQTKCYACQIKDGLGYPPEIRKDLVAMGVI